MRYVLALVLLGCSTSSPAPSDGGQPIDAPAGDADIAGQMAECDARDHAVWAWCDGACTDIGHDPENCGECRMRCGPGMLCLEDFMGVPACQTPP